MRIHTKWAPASPHLNIRVEGKKKAGSRVTSGLDLTYLEGGCHCLRKERGREGQRTYKTAANAGARLKDTQAREGSLEVISPALLKKGKTAGPWGDP